MAKALARRLVQNFGESPSSVAPLAKASRVTPCRRSSCCLGTDRVNWSFAFEDGAYLLGGLDRHAVVVDSIGVPHWILGIGPASQLLCLHSHDRVANSAAPPTHLHTVERTRDSKQSHEAKLARLQASYLQAWNESTAVHGLEGMCIYRVLRLAKLNFSKALDEDTWCLTVARHHSRPHCFSRNAARPLMPFLGVPVVLYQNGP